MRHFGWRQEHDVKLAAAPSFGELARLIGGDDEGQAGDGAVRRGLGLGVDAGAAQRLLATDLVDLGRVEDNPRVRLTFGLVSYGDEYLYRVAGSQTTVNRVVG